MEARATRRWSPIARVVQPEELAAFPLAGVPGFHSLARTALVGTQGPGGAVLDVWCVCSDVAPVAQIKVSWKRQRDPSFFAFTEMGGGTIVVTPGLDLRTEAGHFITPDVWATSPDGWQQIGPVDKTKVAALKRALKPAGARAAIPEVVAADPICGCGHESSFHDPCSKCECPGFHKPGKKVEKFKRRAP